MEGEKIPVSPSDREYRKKRVEELGSALAQIRARVKATRGSGSKKDEEPQQAGGSDLPEDTERTAQTKKLLEEDRVRFSKLQQSRVRMKEEYDQILIEREEQKKVEKQLQEVIAKVTAPTPELPPLIKQRIIDLETSVENLKERLSEKDKVLSSKTQALTVLHNQLMQRSQEQVEKAMAFTQEISTIKEDFKKREELFKNEINRLKEREEELELRLFDKDTHSNEFESLQLELAEVRKELNESLSKSEESSKTLESTKKINLKLKAQLKAMKIERDKLKQTVESMEDSEALKNRIVLLEEEKGNLQLQLVDFDDFKESLTEAERRAKQLEEALGELQNNFKLLEQEKQSLQENLESANKQIEDQDTLIESLKTSLKELEEQKISAEMRSIEIEEKMEALQNQSSAQLDQLYSEISSLKTQLDERNNVIQSLSNNLSLKEQEIFDIKGNNFPAAVETDSRLREIESYNSELVEKVRELQMKSDGHQNALVQLNEMLVEKNDTINSWQMKCEELTTAVTDLNNNKNVLENEIKLLKLKEAHKCPQVENIENKEDPNLTQKFKKLAANYKIKVKLCQELEEKLKSSNSVLNEKQLHITELTHQLTDLKSEIQSLKNNEASVNSALEIANAKNVKLIKMVEEYAPRLEAMEAERSTAVIKANQMNKAFAELKEWKEGDSKLLKEHVTSVNSMASHVSLLEQELQNLQSIVNEKNGVIGELESERKKLVEDMRNSESELERLRTLYESESVKNQNVLTNLQGLENEMLVSRQEMNQIAEQLDSVTKNYNTCLGNLQERENYIEALEQDIVGMKTKMYNLESGIGDRHRMLEERGSQLSARLEEAEILAQTFDKYQTEVEKKIKMMEDNEKTMASNLQQLQQEIDKLNNLNQELKLKNNTNEKRINEITTENETLRDVKKSYNFTLDQIEILNEQLKQVMGDFESKTQEIVRLGEERAELFNKLTDLEDAYSDLKTQLEESEENTVKLQTDLSVKTNILENTILEVKSLEKLVQELKSKDVADKQTTDNTDIVRVFSWDEHSHGKPNSNLPVASIEESPLKYELDEKKIMLADAQKEIYHLQLKITSVLSEKDAEISALRDEISSLLKENNGFKNSFQCISNIPSEGNIAEYSWNRPHRPDISSEYLTQELDETNVKLEVAEKEITRLESSIDCISAQNEAELEKSLVYVGNRGNNDEIQLFSWGEHNPGWDNESGDSLKYELQEKNKLLNIAKEEIANLKAALSSMQSEKESVVSVLKEEINTLMKQKENLGSTAVSESTPISDVKQDDDVRMFSWEQQNSEVGKNDEEGWGWIGAEAHLEHDHKHSEAVQIETLTKRVKELENEQSTLLEKLNASKIKCVKLIKKVKEMEAIQEQTKTKKTIGFSDLDFALQEEMRSQLDQLENKNKELSSELNSLKLERDNLNKKVDVLVSANDQLIEMKERQDIEVQMWQKRSAELKNEVQGLQWSLEEMKSEIPSLAKGDEDLSDKLNLLARENEELQSIICNLKEGRPLGSPEISAEIAALKEELKKLKDVRAKEKESFEIELRKANEELDAMELQFDSLSKENQALTDKLNETSQNFSRLNGQIENLIQTNKQYEDRLSSQKESSPEVECKIDRLMNENEALRNQVSNLSHLSNELESLKKEFDNILRENSNLRTQVISAEENSTDASSLLVKLEALELENSHLKEKLANATSSPSEHIDNQAETLQQHLDYVTAELSILKSEYQKVSSDNQTLQEELIQMKESSYLDSKQYSEKLEKSENTLKNLENSLNSALKELENICSIVEIIMSKYKLPFSPVNNNENLNHISNYIDSLNSKNLQLEKEIALLKETMTSDKKELAAPVPPGSSPPVFTGFAGFGNDPFENMQENQRMADVEIVKLRTENADLHTLIQSYDVEISRLNAEKVSYEQVIMDLNSKISSMNEHVGQQSNQFDDLRQKLERAESEIAHWRDEASSLRREINSLIDKHSQEIDELRRNEAGSKEKLSEIEENFQNTMLNKDQESRNLKQILSEKEQLLANAINERNALQSQFESISQQVYSLESRVRELTQENNDLQSSLNQTRGEENTVIQKQKEEIQELMSKLEYLNKFQNMRGSESENEKSLKKQLKEMSDNLSFLELSNSEMQSKLTSQSEEISRLQAAILELENKKAYLENLVAQKQTEPMVVHSLHGSSSVGESEQLVTLIKEKDLEIARVSQVLLDTQQRLVQVQDSKPMDKVMSLQAKLDQALYTLHSRDVRIDELTEEIMRLLGERDSLQLRLSEALREIEINKQGPSESSAASSPELKLKLGELHKEYKRDPALQLERENRHTQQMDLYSEKEKGVDSSMDYGIFNWFFSSPALPQPQPPS